MRAEQAVSEQTKARQETASKAKGNGEGQPRKASQPRGISDPSDVAHLVLMQVDAVNAKKDELTIAIKGLADLIKQLVRAFGEHTRQTAACLGGAGSRFYIFAMFFEGREGVEPSMIALMAGLQKQRGGALMLNPTPFLLKNPLCRCTNLAVHPRCLTCHKERPDP